MKKFPKWLVVLIIFAVCVIALFSCYKNTYNSLVYMEENVSGQWAEVQNQYQRRMDLIPNLVSTVKGYASHESEVFKQVSDARSKAGGQINISDEVLSNPEAFERYQQVQDQLGSSLQRLLMVTENYPELKADQNFLALQDQLEGTENRITVARGRYNDAAKQYNSKIRSFPTNLIANMSGFEKKIYFSASAEAQSAPKVEF
ncbi:MAG: LemA family protein [Spirochaetia bacterium]|nr:LemA family protein [Spirochaetia bacterium]MDD7610544.1 LemA family protein [Spirochaetales bacterium]MDY5916353.1 LemA family protein [Treponema sp.]